MPVIQEPVAVSIQKVLLATDFSAPAENAAAYARALCQHFSAKLEIAHIFNPTVVSSYEQAIISTPACEMRQLSDERLAKLAGGLGAPGLEIQTLSTESHNPAKAVLEIAKDQNADLIVAGTQSKSGFARLLLGSTAEQIIRHAECPVLTVGPKVPPPPSTPLIFRSIVYATDFSVEAAKAAAYAFSLAEDSGAHLYCCYVLDPDEASPESEQTLSSQFQLALERMIPPSAFDWCTPECVVKRGEATRGILDLAQTRQADLIVLGARKASFWLTHVASGVTSSLLAEAACPILTIC